MPAASSSHRRLPKFGNTKPAKVEHSSNHDEDSASQSFHVPEEGVMPEVAALNPNLHSGDRKEDNLYESKKKSASLREALRDRFASEDGKAGKYESKNKSNGDIPFSGVAIPEESELTKATRLGDIDCVRRLLEMGHDVDGGPNRHPTTPTPLDIAIASGRDDIAELLVQNGAVRRSTRLTKEYVGGKPTTECPYPIVMLESDFHQTSYDDGPLAGTELKTIAGSHKILAEWKRILVKELEIYPLDVFSAASIAKIELGHVTGGNANGWATTRMIKVLIGKGPETRITVALQLHRSRDPDSVITTMHHEIWHCMQRNAIETINWPCRHVPSVWQAQNPDGWDYIKGDWRSKFENNEQQHFFTRYSRHSAHEDGAEVWYNMLTNESCWRYLISPVDTPKGRKVTILLGNFVRRFKVPAVTKFLEALQKRRQWPEADVKQAAVSALERLEKLEKTYEGMRISIKECDVNRKISPFDIYITDKDTIANVKAKITCYIKNKGRVLSELEKLRLVYAGKELKDMNGFFEHIGHCENPKCPAITHETLPPKNDGKGRCTLCGGEWNWIYDPLRCPPPPSRACKKCGVSMHGGIPDCRRCGQRGAWITCIPVIHCIINIST